MWDLAEANKQSHRSITTSIQDNFTRICKVHKLPHEHHGKYRTWILGNALNQSGGKIQDSDIPIDYQSKRYLKPGLTFPYPTGSSWRRLKGNSTNAQSAKSFQQSNIDITNAILNEIHAEISAHCRDHGDKAFNFDSQSKSAAVAYANHLVVQKSDRVNKKKVRFKKTRVKASLPDHIQLPRTVRQALESPDWSKWLSAMNEEMDGLTEMGVLEQKVSSTELQRRGITAKPVPLGVYFDVKTDGLGNVTRYKVRDAIQGHSGNMFKGIHFDNTFTPTPQDDTANVLCALAVRFNLKRRVWDIEKAYCTAPRKTQIALSYPDGFKEFDSDGRELFMVLLRNLYGDPAAARNFGEDRDEKLLNTFSQGPWSITRCFMDPCIFNITHYEDTTCKPKLGNEFDREGITTQFGMPGRTQLKVEVHVDDIDGFAETDDILDLFQKEAQEKCGWTLKNTSADYVLGVNRRTTIQNNKLTAIECTMTAYVDGMTKAFIHRLPKKNVSTPYPTKSVVSKDDQPPEAEIKEVLEWGYQRACGLVLWAVRRVFKEGSYGASMCTSVMAKPSYQAFDNLMHLMKWIQLNREVGIKFSADGNSQVIGFSDASNKPILASGLCQGGGSLHYMNGPISAISKRLHHVGCSAEHNEYMALHLIIKRVVWLRQLLREMGIHEAISAPTVVYGDNVQANKLCQEHFVSTGNQYIATQYHFNREKVLSGDVIIHWVRTVFNVADIFTKPLEPQVIRKLSMYLLGHHNGFDELLSKYATDSTLTILKEDS
jgi:hypothetical protein